MFVSEVIRQTLWVMDDWSVRMPVTTLRPIVADTGVGGAQMAQQSQVRNPFQLMVEPEVVLAAIERSERLGRLNRHLCRPLDRQVTAGGATAAVPALESGEDDEASSEH